MVMSKSFNLWKYWLTEKALRSDKYFINNEDYTKTKEEYEEVMREIYKTEMELMGINLKFIPAGMILKPELQKRIDILKRFDDELEKVLLKDKEIVDMFGGADILENLLRLNENIRTFLAGNVEATSNAYLKFKIMKAVVKIWKKIKGGGDIGK